MMNLSPGAAQPWESGAKCAGALGIYVQLPDSRTPGGDVCQSRGLLCKPGFQIPGAR